MLHTNLPAESQDKTVDYGINAKRKPPDPCFNNNNRWTHNVLAFCRDGKFVSAQQEQPSNWRSRLKTSTEKLLVDPPPRTTRHRLSESHLNGFTLSVFQHRWTPPGTNSAMGAQMADPIFGSTENERSALRPIHWT